MGLLNFWKKKASDQLALPHLDNQQLSTDLPPIDGSSFDGSAVQSYNNMQQLPAIDNPMQIDGSKSISFNVPTLDFSLPPSDDAPLLSLEASLNPKPATPQLEKPLLDEEDLNHLFINDTDWKEPDWNNFEPYPEEKIDEPKPGDFKAADLPQFDEDIDRQSSQMISDEPVLAPAEPFGAQQKSGTKPVELFIRGKSYNRVFTELDQMNKTLIKINSQLDTYEDMLKREEPLLMVAKDQMEYLYRRLNQVDKKIFAQ
jgi:hypothetical protein